MKPSLAAALILLCGLGVLAQGTRTTTQFDFWNWYALKSPAPAEGIVADPLTDNVLYATTQNGLYVSSDGGNTWVQRTPNHIAKEAFTFDPSNANRVLAGMGTTLWLSMDHAATFTQIGTFSGEILSVFVSPTDQSIFVGLHFAYNLSGIYRSPDNGQSWIPIPFGASFPGLSTTASIAEDSSGGLWVATQGAASTPGKMMILRSADRGATWSDVTGPLTAPATKLLWNGATGAMYAASPGGGVIATGNQGARWVTYVTAGAQSVVLARLPATISTWPGLLAGLDAGAGGGAVFANPLLPSDVINPTIHPGITYSMGLQGVGLQSMALNHSSTRFYAAGSDGGIYTGTLMQPQLNPNKVSLTPGDILVVACQTCPMTSSMAIAIAGQQTNLVLDPVPSGGPNPSQIWNVPSNMAPGTYPAQLLSGFPPIPFTVVIGSGASTVPTISEVTSVSFVVKPQYAVGEVVSLFGTGLTGAAGTTGTNSASTVPLPTQLALSQVMVDGSAAPLYYAYTGPDGSSQINFQIPSSLLPGQHKLHVNRLLTSGAINQSTADLSFTISAINPTYISDSSGNVYLQNVTQDPSGGTFASATTPAHPNDVVVIYATGLGALSPNVAAGAVPPVGTLANVSAPVSVSLWDGIVSQWKATVLGAVASPQYPGLYQIAIQLPADAIPNGPSMKLILATGSDSQTSTVYFSLK